MEYDVGLRQKSKTPTKKEMKPPEVKDEDGDVAAEDGDEPQKSDLAPSLPSFPFIFWTRPSFELDSNPIAFIDKRVPHIANALRRSHDESRSSCSPFGALNTCTAAPSTRGACSTSHWKLMILTISNSCLTQFQVEEEEKGGEKMTTTMI